MLLCLNFLQELRSFVSHSSCHVGRIRLRPSESRRIYRRRSAGATVFSLIRTDAFDRAQRRLLACARRGMIGRAHPQ
jgi:hypothetical protein